MYITRAVCLYSVQPEITRLILKYYGRVEQTFVHNSGCLPVQPKIIKLILKYYGCVEQTFVHNSSCLHVQPKKI